MPTPFDDIIEKLNANELWDFPGGVHPPQYKSLSNQQAIAVLPIPERLYVPLKQHIGVEGHLIVEAGQHVLKGQPLTKSMNPFAVPIHAPTSGTIVNITPHVSAHPSGLKELTVEIEADMQDTWCALTPLTEYQKQPKMAILAAICDAGITGMGGAGFPTHIKSAPKKNVEFLIINGIECEPYISSDDRLMREHAWQIRQGIDVLSHLLTPKQVLIGIEDNKPEAIEAMKIACGENPHYRVCTIPTKYPAGGEKQLIQVLTNREVPSGGLPMDVGVIMQNVGTCYAIADAIFTGKPLTQRVVTVTGKAVNIRRNYWTLIGTPVEHLLNINEYQAKRQKVPTVIMGGPMMGFTVATSQVPIVKTTNCILVPTNKELAGSLSGSQEQACIRCGACADVCPASLLPQQLFWHAKAKELDKAQEYNLFDCIECGACAYVCPSEIPLVHYYRIAKADVRIEQQEKQKSDKARERFENRAARLIADQQARDEKHRLAAEARKQAMAQNGDDAKDKIAAALARAKQKKQQQANSDNPASDSSEPLAVSASTTKETETQAASNNDRVQAAIARAKAKKAANEVAKDSPHDDTPTTPVASNNDRVQAAIARAKAKKAASIHSPVIEIERSNKDTTQQKETKEEKSSQVELSPSRQQKPVESNEVQALSPSKKDQSAADTTIPENAEKQRRIAAAVAKAKAKRSQVKEPSKETPQNLSTEPRPSNNAGAEVGHETAPQGVSNTQSHVSDEKKRRIAAAVAKAKAKAKAKKIAEKAANDEKQK